MANTIIKRTWNRNRMVNIEDLQGFTFQSEDDAHTFEISGIDDDGNSVPLIGTVAGVFRRADNADIALTGTSADGVASVTLTEDCYAVIGRFALTIFVTADSQTTAVYAAIGTVAQTSGNGVAGDTPQDVVDLINAISAAVATIPADYTDLMAAIAPTYSNTALYAVGAYAWYNGSLYCCTTDIITAESWNASHWMAVSLGTDVYDIKSGNFIYERLVNDGEYTIQLSDLESGSWASSSASKITNTARARVRNLIPVHPGMVIEYDDSTYDSTFYVYATKSSTAQQSGWVNGKSVYEITSDGLLGILFRNHADTSATVNVNNIDSVVTIRTDAGSKSNQYDSAVKYIGSLGKVPDEIRAKNLFEGAQYNGTAVPSTLALTKIEHGVHVEGTLPYHTVRYLCQRTITLKANTKYTLYCESDATDVSAIVSPGSLVEVPVNDAGSFTTDAEKTGICVSLYQTAEQDGMTIDNDFHVYLVEGEYTVNELARNDVSSVTDIENIILEENVVLKNSISSQSGDLSYNPDYGIAYVNGVVPGSAYIFVSTEKEGQSASGLFCGVHTYDKSGQWLGRAYSLYAGDGEVKYLRFADGVETVAITYPFKVVDVVMNGRVAVDTIARQQIKDLREIKDPTVSMKKNSALQVSEIISVAETYYEHRNDKVNDEYTMVYGGNTVLNNNFDGNAIDCSAFIGLVYRGIPYEDTAYGKPGVINDPDSYVANPDYVWSVNLYEHKEKAENDSLDEKKVRTAAQIAEYMVNQGYSVINTDDDYVNVEPGDIVFYADTTPDGYKQKYRYLHISHVAMCISKTKNPAGSTYPWSHQVINVVRETPCVKKQELETVWADQIVLIMRPDLGSIGYDGTKLTLGNTTLNEEQLIALLGLIS